MRTLSLSPEAATIIRREIARARGNEVCFIAAVDDEGNIHDPRVVARGHASAVLAVVRDAEPGSMVLHNHPSGNLDPSDADFHVAARLYDQSLGFAIVDNDVEELYVVVEPPAVQEVQPLDPALVARLLGPDGPLAGAHPSYEDRVSQREMASSIVEGYNNNGIVLAEAGTGTGKSVAYLVPAIKWAIANRQRTVVSTNTINLQEQLVEKDLPLLKRALGDSFRYALVKGRQNYISIRRAKLAEQSQTVLFDDAQSRGLAAVLEWLETTEDGSLQTLPFTPPAEVWDEVVSDSDVCLRAKCPHFESCFYQKARRSAASADILVVNHHLLFSDLAVRRSQDNYTAPAVLPPYRRVVLDEAHNIEDAATEHLGASITRRALIRIFNRLDRRGKGVLSAVEAKLLKGSEDLLRQDALAQIENVLRPGVNRARELATELFSQLEMLVIYAEDGILRLRDDFTGSPAWTGGLDALHESNVTMLDQLAKGIERLRETILVDRQWSELLNEQLVELRGVANRVAAAAEALRMGFIPPKERGPLVRWIERRTHAGGDANVLVRSAPVDISALMREALFDRIDTAVLTSATLATRDGFRFLRRRIGLGAGLPVREAVYASPFDYDAQAVIALPTDLPLPDPQNSAGYDAATTAVIEQMAAITGGGVFALFTSYRSLRSVATQLRRRGVHTRWPLFIQGEGPRSKLLEQFTAAGNGVLLGVASFWEGVDVPGDPLRGLVIVKLPFRVPSEPLTAARIEAIEQEGRSSFMEYLLPQAALRLKQGFGRLIRSRADRGAVVLLDRRVIEKGYGRYFLESLPPTPVLQGPWPDLRFQLSAFYDGPRLALARS